MLSSLIIQNYAIIQDLKIDFSGGLSIITGETGAGKSILLGALSLLTGNRADSSVLFDESRKCIVEGTFHVKGYGLETLFQEYDLDFLENTLIRREINPDGKSRAFINDSPVNVSVLREIGEKLIDIHSQHQNLYIETPAFQLRVLDTFARHPELIQQYSDVFQQFRLLTAEYQKLSESAAKEKADLDYYTFQYQQLTETKLKEGEQEELEEELKFLTHAEEIKLHLGAVLGNLSGEELSVIAMVKDSLSSLGKISQVMQTAASFEHRLEECFIELKDLASDIENQYEKTEFDPERAGIVRQRIDMIYNLQQKHRVSSVKELLDIEARLKESIGRISNADERLDELKTEIDKLRARLGNIASQLSQQRKAVIPRIEERVGELLRQLGMPNAVFQVELTAMEEFTSSGADKVKFLFSANRQSLPQELSKVASGGEMARLMLSIKVVISEAVLLPTVIFDEIDQGVSGDIADKMGNMIEGMSKYAQVINITHLPQIASKGRNHFLVYKTDLDEKTLTRIKHLKSDERVIEIARMLSGEQLSEAAINNAKALLGMN